jgi:hypothetical protein
MERETDIVESLIRSAGRRVEPPEEAYRLVFAAATAALRSRMARRRRRLRGLWAGAAAAAVLAAALIFPWAEQAGEGGELARVVRVHEESSSQERRKWFSGRGRTRCS